MNKLLFTFLFSLFVIGLNAQNVSITIVPSTGDYGLTTDCNSNIIAFDILIEIDQAEWQLRSYNIWTDYPKPSMAYSNDISCISQDAGDTNNDEFGQFRVGGANGFTTIAANTPTVFHTIAYNFNSSAALEGETITVGGEAFLYGLSFSTTITLVNELTNISVGLVVTPSNSIVLDASTFPCMFGAMPIINLGNCKTRFIGYPPADNGTLLTANVSNGTPPFSFSWSPAEYVTNGIDSQSATVYPVVPTDFSVEVTDANGITVVNSVFVDVVDVIANGSSSNNDSEIIICHKSNGHGGEPVQITVPFNSVEEYLNSGSTLGPCSSPCANNNVALDINEEVINNIQFINLLEAYPNPTTGPTSLTYKVFENQKISLDIIDMLGKSVNEIFSGNVIADKEYSQELDLKLISGVYFIRMITEKETLKYKLVIKN